MIDLDFIERLLRAFDDNAFPLRKTEQSVHFSMPLVTNNNCVISLPYLPPYD